MKDRIKEMLENLKKDKVIEDWGVANYEYWSNIPYIDLAEGRLFLATKFLKFGSSNISTIFDCKTENAVKKYLDFIVKNRNALATVYISDYGELKEYVQYDM